MHVLNQDAWLLRSVSSYLLLHPMYRLYEIRSYYATVAAMRRIGKATSRREVSLSRMYLKNYTFHATLTLTATALSSERQAMMTWAPSIARALAVTYPMPVLPPVITATFPCMLGGRGTLRLSPLPKDLLRCMAGHGWTDKE